MFASDDIVLLFSCLNPLPHSISTLFPYTTLFRSVPTVSTSVLASLPYQLLNPIPINAWSTQQIVVIGFLFGLMGLFVFDFAVVRSEEHTSELQSRENLVCSLLLELKN